MKIAIMQPYFFPYIGYWQLINAVDKFIIYDDVNYIKGGWINRNRIIADGKPHNINLLLSGKSPNKLINEINILNDKVIVKKFLKTIEMSYSKALHFKEVYPMIDGIMNQHPTNLAKYLLVLFEKVCAYLGIKTELLMSSEIEKDNNRKGKDKIIDICKILKASDYYNAIGGMELYDKTEFSCAGINLKFIKTGSIGYKQFDNEFISNLSIIDVMMFNSVAEINEMLNNFELI